MVDESRDNGHNSSKSRAYTALTAELKERDGADFQLSLLHHRQKLQQVYSSSQLKGWTADEMATKESLAWMYEEVMWRIEQSDMVWFDEDYYSLAYDECVKAGVYLEPDSVGGVNLQDKFDSAGDNDTLTGDQAATKGLRTPKSPWSVADDHDLMDVGSIQTDGVDSEELWRAPPPAADTAGGGGMKKPDYTEAIQAAVQQLADTTDVNAMMILQAKITCLEAQQKKQQPITGSHSQSPLGNKLPDKLVASYDFLQSRRTIVEHLELLDDFLFLRKDKEYFVHFLIQSLTGDTLRLFREQLKAIPDMSYQDACGWLKLTCIHRDERDRMNKELQNIQQKKGERVQAYVLRARAIRAKLDTLDVRTDNYHMRQHLEAGLDSAVRKQLHLEEGHEKLQFRAFIRRIISIDIALNGTQTKTGTATGMAMQIDDADSDEQVTMSKSDLQSYTDKKVHMMMVKKGFTSKRKINFSKSDDTSNKKRKASLADLKKSGDLPDIAEEKMMKRYYKPDIFKKKLEYSASGESKKDKPEFYKHDRWGFNEKMRFACFNCRKLGHTADRCPDDE